MPSRLSEHAKLVAGTRIPFSYFFLDKISGRSRIPHGRQRLGKVDSKARSVGVEQVEQSEPVLRLPGAQKQALRLYHRNMA